MRQNLLGIFALFTGVLALGLAVLPRILLQPTEASLPSQELSAPQDEKSSAPGLTLKYKQFSVTLSSRQQKEELPESTAEKQAREAREEHQQDLARVGEQLRFFTLAASSFALLGLILGPIAWTKEKQPALSGSAIGICCLALMWQYLLAGIVLGVAIAVLLVVLKYLPI